MLLQDIYKLFPEYKKKQFRFTFVRNEIIITIDIKTGSKIIIHYFNSNKIDLIIYDAKLSCNACDKQSLAAKGINVPKNSEISMKTNAKSLKHDLSIMQKAIANIGKEN